VFLIRVGWWTSRARFDEHWGKKRKENSPGSKIPFNEPYLKLF